MFKYAVACALAAAALADNAPTYHPAPAPYHAPAPPAPKPYAFEYGVADDYSGAKFTASETSNAKVVSGSYTVALPDGRTQIVTYTSDPYGPNGHVADVKYEGVATYPEAKAYHPAPKPVYHPAPKPVYHPAPTPVYHA